MSFCLILFLFLLMPTYHQILGYQNIDMSENSESQKQPQRDMNAGMLQSSSNERPQTSTTRKIIEQQRAKLLQQLKIWKKNQMRQEIRQEVLQELQPKIQQQLKDTCAKLMTRFMQLTQENNERWWQCLMQNMSNLSNQFNQSLVQQEQVEKKQPMIAEQPEERQQDTQLDRRSNSFRRDRTLDAKRRRPKKRKNSHDASDSESSQESSDSNQSRCRNQRIMQAMKKGIDYAFQLCHKQIREKYHLTPKKKP